MLFLPCLITQPNKQSCKCSCAPWAIFKEELISADSYFLFEDWEGGENSWAKEDSVGTTHEIPGTVLWRVGFPLISYSLQQLLAYAVGKICLPEQTFLHTVITPCCSEKIARKISSRVHQRYAHMYFYFNVSTGALSKSERWAHSWLNSLSSGRGV